MPNKNIHRLLLAGFVLLPILTVLYAFYPGFVSHDSILCLQQARGLTPVSNWFPPIMAYLWRIVDWLIPGAFGMLLLQVSLYWISLAIIIFNTTLRRSIQAGLFLLVGFFPPLLMYTSTIWKDVGLMVAYLASYAMLIEFRKRRSSIFLALSFLFLFYGLAVRLNSAPAALPLLFLITSELQLKFLKHISTALKHSIASLVIFMLFLGLTVFISTYKVERTSQWPVLWVWDIAGISIQKAENYLPDFVFIRDKLKVSEYASHFEQGEAVSLCIFGKISCYREQSGNPNDKTLFQVWKDTIAHNPKEYVVHRLKVMKHLFGLQDGPVRGQYAWGVEKNKVGLTFTPGKTQLLIMSKLSRIRNSFLFRGWLYLTLSLIVLLLTLRPKYYSRDILLLNCSGILYMLPYLFVAIATDFRFLSWFVMSTVLCCCLMFAKRQSDSKHLTPKAQLANR